MSATMAAPTAGFSVTLDVFTGPFDLLLSLIAKRQLDLTEVALADVADEFVAHIRSAGFDLDKVTEFLVVAATLLDLKASRLLPALDVEDDEEDLALLEARDLLFARLLQYRAYKRAAALLSDLADLESRYAPRSVPIEERYAAALPEPVISIDAAGIAELARGLREPKPPPQVDVDHVHAPRVDVRAHARVVVERLMALGTATFEVLCEGCQERIEVVARFLALLELFREGRVSFEQPVPLGTLAVTWTGGTDDSTVTDELPLPPGVT